jgi:hypothetical protein
VEERKANGLPPLDSFEAMAREWFDIKNSGSALRYAEEIIGLLVADVFPYIGHDPEAEITPVRLLEVLRRIEKRASSRLRTGRWRTAARSSATRWPPAG